ncbi:pyridoxal phosphate-dependent transferase [Lipomyces oligophaga]|uniref:pyridoxal phosphate-dependent transferase n=1 Tax=Lipomyces oligophaga TaxID=45792 RepID=UPI0034CF1C81
MPAPTAIVSEEVTVKQLNRADELAQVLSAIGGRAIDYLRAADVPGSHIGGGIPPEILRSQIESELELPEYGTGQEGLLRAVDTVLGNSIVTWHEGFMDKLYASTNSAGVAADLVLSMLNTNGYVYTVAPALTLVEKKTSKEYANLFGFKSRWAGGITLPGGSASNAHSIIVARSTLFPDTRENGNGSYKFVVFTSVHGHYSVEKAAISAGLGSSAVVTVPVDSDMRMRTDKLEQLILEAQEAGKTPLYVNATAGTTVYGSYDPFVEISAIAKKYRLWMHVDGSWGGNVVFSERLRVQKLNGVELADSVTANPHKMLGVPLTCSFLLAPDARVFRRASSLRAPYLFHDEDQNEVRQDFDLGDFTMGCGRRADALKLFLGWKWFGRAGYGERVELAFDTTAYFANKISSRKGFYLLSSNPPPCLQTCFYYSPRDEPLQNEAEYNTRCTRAIAKALHQSGRFLVDYAPPAEGDSVGKGEFFRAVVNAPSTTRMTVDELVDAIERLAAAMVETGVL